MGRISAAVFFSFQKWQISLRGKRTPILKNPNEKKSLLFTCFFLILYKLHTLIPIFGLLTLLAVFNELFTYCSLDIVSGIEPSYAGHRSG